MLAVIAERYPPEYIFLDALYGREINKHFGEIAQ